MVLFTLFGLTACVAAKGARPPARSSSGPDDSMVFIPGSTFMMGTDSSDVPRLLQIFGVRRTELFAPEIPRHQATVHSFYLDKYEVTNRQFRMFIEVNPAWLPEKVLPRYHNGNYLKLWNGSDRVSLCLN